MHSMARQDFADASRAFGGFHGRFHWVGSTGLAAWLDKEEKPVRSRTSYFSAFGIISNSAGGLTASYELGIIALSQENYNGA